MRRLSLYLLVLLVLPLAAHAQFIEDLDIFGTGLSLVVEPEYPAPFEPYTVSLNDFGSDTFGAAIQWVVDGEVLVDESNKRAISLRADAAGKKTEISASLTKANGQVLLVRHLVSPVYLDIIIEPQTHTPSFFQGRALPSPGSTVNATALLSAPTLLGTNYIYTWRVNDTILDQGPQRGRSAVTFTMPQDPVSVLSLQVNTPDGTPVTRRAITLPAVPPKLLFYEVHPLFGLSKKAIAPPLTLVGNSTTIRAVPFYLDSQVFNNPDVLEWKIGSDRVSTGANPYEITAERTSETGRATLSFRVLSTAEFLQNATGELVIDTTL